MNGAEILGGRDCVPQPVEVGLIGFGDLVEGDVQVEHVYVPATERSSMKFSPSSVTSASCSSDRGDLVSESRQLPHCVTFLILPPFQSRDDNLGNSYGQLLATIAARPGGSLRSKTEHRTDVGCPQVRGAGQGRGGPGPVIGRGDNDVIPNMATVAQTRVSDQWVATRRTIEQGEHG